MWEFRAGSQQIHQDFKKQKLQPYDWSFFARRGFSLALPAICYTNQAGVRD
jgi:hypothetical protein